MLIKLTMFAAGSTEQARVRSDMTYSLQLSIRMTIVSAFYNPNFVSVEHSFRIAEVFYSQFLDCTLGRIQ